MTRAVVLGGVLLVLATTASAESSRPRADAQTSGVAAPAPTPAAAETPSMVRDALVGLGLFHQHEGLDGRDPASIARARQPATRRR